MSKNKYMAETDSYHIFLSEQTPKELAEEGGLISYSDVNGVLWMFKDNNVIGMVITDYSEFSKRLEIGMGGYYDIKLSPLNKAKH